MSDAPSNPDRVWDAGLRDDDLSVFISVREVDGKMVAAATANVFTIGAMRATVGLSKLGPPKSASEGAERDREWATTVPKQPGVVLEVTDERIRTQLESGRRQTYRLTGRNPKRSYVHAGDTFTAGDTFIAGAVERPADLALAAAREWGPVADLGSESDVTRYAAVKACAHVGREWPAAFDLLSQILEHDPDPRVKLEAAGALARLGRDEAIQLLGDAALGHDRKDLQMEAVLIASELGDEGVSVLEQVAAQMDLANSELRQAAVWGLGRGGARQFASLQPYLLDDDVNVVLHAIAAYDSGAGKQVIEALGQMLANVPMSARATVSAALVRIGGRDVIGCLASMVSGTEPGAEYRSWLLATLGQLLPSDLRAELAESTVLAEVSPLMMLSEQENWLARPTVNESFRFLLGQDL